MYKKTVSIALVIALILSLAIAGYAAKPAENIVKYDPASNKIVGLETNMSYCTGSSKTGTFSAWKSVDATTANNGLTVTAGVYYRICFTITTDEFIEIGPIGSGGDAPTGISYDGSKFTGLSTTIEYNTTSATATVWISCTSTTLTVARKDVKQSFWFRKKATSSTMASAAVQIDIDAGTKSDISGIKVDYESERFTGFDGSDWKITTQGASYSGDYLYSLTSQTIAYPDTTYYLRRATDTVGSALTTPKRPNAPTGIYFEYSTTSDTGKIKGVSSKMRYGKKPDQGFTVPWTSITGDSVDIVQTDEEQIVYVALKATETDFASFNYTLTIKPKSQLSSEFNALRYESGVIKGVSDVMEYQVAEKDVSAPDWEGDWTVCPDDSLQIERTDYEQLVFFRLKGETEQTKYETIKVKAFYEPPNVSLDLNNSVIYGFNQELEYVYSTSSSWKDIPDTMLKMISLSTSLASSTSVASDSSEVKEAWAFDISSLLKGKAITISVAQKPDSGNPESESVTKIEIDAGPDKEKVSVSNYVESGGVCNAVVSGKVNMQYKLETDDTWSEPVESSGNILLPVGHTASVYLFRMAPTGSKQASPESKLKVAKPASMPKVKIDYKKEIITIKGGQSYSYDSLTWNDVAKGSKYLLNLNDEDLYGNSIYVRTTATNKKPSSEIAVMKINPRVPNPPDSDDVKIITVNGKQKVVMRSGGRQIEYYNNGKWKKGVPKYSDTLDTLVRFAADDNFGPSTAVVFNSRGVAN